MNLPNIILPSWFGSVISLLHSKPPRFILVNALNYLLKRDLLPADMSYFSGQKFEIDVLDAGLRIRSVSYTHLTLPTILRSCRSRWSPYH